MSVTTLAATDSALSYTAAEIFDCKPYTPLSDTYSLGAILLDVLLTDCLTAPDEQGVSVCSMYMPCIAGQRNHSEGEFDAEDTLQLRICARYDHNILTKTIENLSKDNHEISSLINRMMNPIPDERIGREDFSQNEFIVKCMRQIDSHMMEYTASIIHENEKVDELMSNEQTEYYLEYLKLNQNDGSRVQQCLLIFCESYAASINTLVLATYYLNDIVPLIEHFQTKGKIAFYGLELLEKILTSDHREYILKPNLIVFIKKMIPNDLMIIMKLTTVLKEIFSFKTTTFEETNIVLDIARILNKYDTNVTISSNCCTIFWHMINEPSSLRDLYQNKVSVLNSLLNLSLKLDNNVDIFTKICFAFMPLLFQKSIIDYLAQYNLVRYFTIGLQKHSKNRQAVKSERCVMRYLCSRLSDETLLDSMKVLNNIFDYHENHPDVVYAIITLLKSMIQYDDAIDEMVSTSIDNTLIFKIKRFHNDDREIMRTCDEMLHSIKNRRLLQKRKQNFQK
ncbi:unnamed protein product [Didymodactylos carnosus]|uniref:Protein kinase domain-containing protein n=1 Tax=Didymodactylos carnosus TaxID=1234261 RepID=A0A8S2HPC2_9BILA|nr:unnamed protein product [Didymodactylos carnosus]CAF3669160.1 unnamed protein product [Didymodactylos carnosus]